MVGTALSAFLHAAVRPVVRADDDIIITVALAAAYGRVAGAARLAGLPREHRPGGAEVVGRREVACHLGDVVPLRREVFRRFRGVQQLPPKKGPSRLLAVDAGARTAAFAPTAVIAVSIRRMLLSDRITAPKIVVLTSFAGTAVMAFVAVFQPPGPLVGATFIITLAIFLGIGTGGVFAWVARTGPVRGVGHRHRRRGGRFGGYFRRW